MKELVVIENGIGYALTPGVVIIDLDEDPVRAFVLKGEGFSRECPTITELEKALEALRGVAPLVLEVHKESGSVETYSL